MWRFVSISVAPNISAATAIGQSAITIWGDTGPVGNDAVEGKHRDGAPSTFSRSQIPVLYLERCAPRAHFPSSSNP